MICKKCNKKLKLILRNHSSKVLFHPAGNVITKLSHEISKSHMGPVVQN